MKGLLICIGLAIAMFYGFFFELAPWLAGMLPQGEWNGVMTIVVYALVAYFGGLGLPIMLIGFGIMLYVNE
jgi:hypothetical protein